MSSSKTITLADLQNTAAAKRNPHLFRGKETVHVINQQDPVKNKYGNTNVVIDDIEFDSKKEARRYVELRGRQMAGEITDLRTQKEYDLIVNGEHIAYYLADFEYKENGELVVEDVKSRATRKLPVYRLKMKLMEAIYNIKIKEV